MAAPTDNQDSSADKPTGDEATPTTNVMFGDKPSVLERNDRVIMQHERRHDSFGDGPLGLAVDLALEVEDRIREHGERDNYIKGKRSWSARDDVLREKMSDPLGPWVWLSPSKFYTWPLWKKLLFLAGLGVVGLAALSLIALVDTVDG